MSGQLQTVLAQMARAGQSGVEPQVDFSAAPGVVAKAAQRALSGLLQAEVIAAPCRCGVAPLTQRLSSRGDPGVFYWTMDETGAPAALFAVDPGFAAVLTERLLGGALSAPEAGAVSQTLDFDMASALIDILAPALNAAFAKQTTSAKIPSLQGKRGVRLKADAVRDIETMSVYGLSIDLRYGEAEAPAAFDILFASRFIERLGLSPAGGAAEGKASNPEWKARLRRNLLDCEIPLTAVLDRFSTSVGALSRLSVGQIIDLDPGAMQGLDITALTNSGPVTVAQGRLGALQSRKAIKLTTRIDPEFLSGL